MLASYLGLFFVGGKKPGGGGGGLTKGGKRDCGRLERKKRVKGKERGRGEQLYIVREGGAGAAAGCLRQNVAFRYGAVMPHTPSSPSAALLSFFILKLSNKTASRRNLLFSASHMASLEVKCSLISPLIKLL